MKHHITHVPTGWRPIKVELTIESPSELSEVVDELGQSDGCMLTSLYESLLQMEEECATELGESPPMLGEPPMEAFDEEPHPYEESSSATNQAIDSIAGIIAHARQLDSAQHRSLRGFLREGIDIGIEAFEEAGE